MRYTRLAPDDREALWRELEAMPAFLATRLASLSPAQLATPPMSGGFSPVEQCWHLADLEREGFGDRIARLLGEEEPLLADFDGAKIARERDYRSRSMQEGLSAFARARTKNLARLQSVVESQWSRSGRQEGVGAIALCDIPVMMAQHDAAHRVEIEQWLAEHLPRTSDVSPKKQDDVAS